jgi:hypothetical protein
MLRQATDLEATEVARSDAQVVVQLRWSEQDAESEFFWLFTVRDRKIVHIKDCPSLRDAQQRARKRPRLRRAA